MPADSPEPDAPRRRRELRLTPPPSSPPDAVPVDDGDGDATRANTGDEGDGSGTPRTLATDPTTAAFEPTWQGSTHRRALVPVSASQAPVVAGRFRVGEILGRGGAAIVHCAHDARLQRDIAIKFLQDERDDQRARFVNEARITGQLQHPNIVPVHELDHDADGRPFLALKRVQGRTLREVIHAVHDDADHGNLHERPARTAMRRRTDVVGPRAPGRTASASAWTIRRLLEAFLKVCDAVSFAHSRGVIHRDLKPSNIMVGDYGEVLVMDWGLARAIDGPPTERGIAGTPGYMAPEQAHGSSQLDEGVDIFSLGAVLYTILTDQLPFLGRTGDEMVAALLEYRLVPPSRRVPDRSVPRELEAIVLKAMARRRRDRYGTVAGLRADVERYLDDRFVEAASYGPLRRLLKWGRRRRAMVLGVSATLAVLMLGSAGTLLAEQHRLAERRARLEMEAREAVLEAEQARLTAEQEDTERRRSEERLARLEADRRRRTAELERLAAEGQIEELIDRLGGTAGTGDGTPADPDSDVFDEFRERLAAGRRLGLSDELIIDAFDEQTLTRYREAFAARFADAAQPGGQPAPPEVYWYLAIITQAGGDHEGALRIAADYLAAFPQRAEAWCLDGLLRSTRDPVAAIQRLNRALAIDPDSTRAWTARGVAKSLQRDWQGALTDLRESLARDPRQTLAWEKRSQCESALGRFEEADVSATRGLDLHPRRALLWAMRAHNRIYLDRLADARADARRALELGDRSGVAHFVLGRLALRTDRRNDAALDWLRTATRLNPDHAAGWYEYGVALWHASDFVTAVDAFRQAVRLEPSNTDFRFRLAGVLSITERFDEAMRQIDRCEQLGAPAGNVALARGYAWLRRPDHDRAMTEAERALDQLRDTPLEWSAWSLRGRVLRARGDLQEGLTDLRRALQMAPPDQQPGLRAEIAETESGADDRDEEDDGGE